jgi:hypothetical protein
VPVIRAIALTFLTVCFIVSFFIVSFPSLGKPIQGQARQLARQVGYGALGQDKEAAIVSYQAEATVALSSAPSDPLVAVLEVLGWSAED